MANHKSAIKRARQNVFRNKLNKQARTRVKSVVKNVNTEIENQSKETAAAALKIAIPIIQRAASKKIIHINKAARKISRLTKKINALPIAQNP
ncbi:MAG: 30S ribosomal protein S20 [Pseudomonadota bacterium]